MTDQPLRFGHRVLDDWLEVCAERDAERNAHGASGAAAWPESTEGGWAEDAALERILSATSEAVQRDRTKSRNRFLRAVAMISLAAFLASWLMISRWDGEDSAGVPIPDFMEILVDPEGSSRAAIQSSALTMHVTLKNALEQCRARGELTPEDVQQLRRKVRDLVAAGPPKGEVAPIMVVAVAGNWQVVERAGSEDREGLTRTEAQAVMDWTLVTVRNYQVMLAQIEEVPSLAASRDVLKEVVQVAVARILEKLEDD